MPKPPLELGPKGGVARDGVTNLAQRCGKAAKTSNIGNVTTQRPPLVTYTPNMPSPTDSVMFERAERDGAWTPNRGAELK